MPRDYHCKKCGNVHPPPTGKRCQWQDAPEEGDEGDNMMPLLQKMQKQIDEIQNSMRRDNTIDADNQSIEQEQQHHDSDSDGAVGSQLATITPESLRSDVRAMQRAAQRMAEFEDSDLEDDEVSVGGNKRRNSKKSGSLMSAADTIKRRIDWPHMFV